MSLDEYLMPDGDWKASYGRLSVDALNAALENPWAALKTVWSPDTNKTLIREFGVARSHFEPFVRKGLATALDEQLKSGTLDGYEAAVVRLAVESLLAQQQGVFPIVDERDRRGWIEAMDPRRLGAKSSNFTGFKSLSPIRVLRLAVTRPALDSSRPIVKRAMPEAILGAIGRLSSGQPVSIETQVRLAVLRYWILTDEGQDLESDPAELLSASGLDEARVRLIVDDIRNERGIERLVSTEGGAVDMARLLRIQRFRESADYFGFRFDPASFDLLRELAVAARTVADPWARQLHMVALGGSPTAAAALAEIGRLRDDRVSRIHAFDFFSRTPALGPAELASVMNPEFEPHGDSLFQRLFRALLEDWMMGRQSETRRALDETGLSGWFDEALEGYRRSGAGARVSRPRSSDLLRAAKFLEANPMQGTSIGRFAEPIVREGNAASSELERSAAEESGRGWLYDFVLGIRAVDPVQYDGNRRILTDDDRDFCRRLVTACVRKNPQWWGERLESNRELRLREAALRSGFGDRGALEELVDGNDQLMRDACTNIRADRVDSELARIRAVILSGQGTADERLIAAFRMGDGDDFRTRLSPPTVELPPKRRRKSLVGKRVLLYSVTVVALVVFQALRTPFARAESWPTADRVVASKSGLAVDPKQARWQKVVDGVWTFNPTGTDVLQFLEVDVVGPVGTRGAAQVEFEIAQEFVARYERHLHGAFPAGVVVNGDALPWKSIEVDLGTKAPAGGSPQGPSVWASLGDAPGWLRDGGRTSSDGPIAASTPARGKAVIHVIIKRK